MPALGGKLDAHSVHDRESFAYASGMPLNTPSGMMGGAHQMESDSAASGLILRYRRFLWMTGAGCIDELVRVRTLRELDPPRAMGPGLRSEAWATGLLEPCND